MVCTPGTTKVVWLREQRRLDAESRRDNPVSRPKERTMSRTRTMRLIHFGGPYFNFIDDGLPAS